MFKSKPGIYPFRYGNKIELLRSGDQYFLKLLELIENAQNEIHLQVYIFEPDETGETVREALIIAANRGVKISLVLDAYGSKNFNSDWLKKLTTHHIVVNFYSPIRFNNLFKMGLRMHHKIVCIDRKYALVGGINISDNYSFVDKKTPWLDYAIFIKGSLTADINRICIETLRKAQGKKTKSKQHSLKPSIAEGPIISRVLQNNWSQAKLGISKQYKTHIKNANEQITLVTSYFIPSISLILLLKKAANRGVDIRIVLGAISDVGLAKNATDYLLNDLLKSGIKLYEWRESVMHAKLAIIDNNTTIIGSYNLNHLSDFGSIECNLEITDEAFCLKTKYEIDEIIKIGCCEITRNQIEKRQTFLANVKNIISYFTFRIMLKLLFFLQNHNSLKKHIKNI
jgi:cardiolipin synthase